MSKLRDITHLSSSGFAVLADKIKKENIPLVSSYMVINRITIYKSKSALTTLQTCFPTIDLKIFMSQKCSRVYIIKVNSDNYFHF